MLAAAAGMGKRGMRGAFFHLGNLVGLVGDLEQLDACEVCPSYCPCLNASEFVDVPDPDISALALLPLELGAGQKGYTPLASAPWATV